MEGYALFRRLPVRERPPARLRHNYAAPAKSQITFDGDRNLGVEHTFKLRMSKRFVKARLDVVNLFDKVYELRDGSGIGVGAPQYGALDGGVLRGSLSFAVPNPVGGVGFKKTQKSARRSRRNDGEGRGRVQFALRFCFFPLCDLCVCPLCTMDLSQCLESPSLESAGSLRFKFSPPPPSQRPASSVQAKRLLGRGRRKMIPSSTA